MKYRIKAPNNTYDRTLNGVRFSNGIAETENPWMAQWFSGRDGFSVEALDEARPELSAQEDEAQEDEAQGAEQKSRVRASARSKK